MTETDQINRPGGAEPAGDTATVTYILVDGSRRSVPTPVGTSIMQTALNNFVPGIEAECGGFMNCATCHVFVDEAWTDRLKPMSEQESDMLDGAVCERQPNSRLSCQIKMSADLDGITVQMPERQM